MNSEGESSSRAGLRQGFFHLGYSLNFRKLSHPENRIYPAGTEKMEKPGAYSQNAHAVIIGINRYRDHCTTCMIVRENGRELYRAKERLPQFLVDYRRE